MPESKPETIQVAPAPVGDVIPPAPMSSSLLFVNEPGVDAEAFLYEVAYQQLSTGRDVVALLLNRSPSTVTSEMASLGYDPEGEPGDLVFVDAFSAMLGVDEDTAYRVEDVEDADALVDALAEASEDHPEAALLMDSISAWIDRVGNQGVLDVLDRFEATTDRFAFTFALHTAWPYEDDTGDVLDRFDGLVRVEGMHDRVLFGQYFEVERLDWAPEAAGGQRHIFQTRRPGGITVYIPKIVVTGPYNSGKSTFVRSISDEAVSVDRLGTTVALDHGHVEMEGISADIFGTPGQVRFDPILETVAGQALGVIVLVDATQSSTFERARELLEKTWSKGLPGVVVANKQDLPNALDAEQLGEKVDPEGRATVVKCVGTDPDSARTVLRHVTDRILRRQVEA